MLWSKVLLKISWKPFNYVIRCYSYPTSFINYLKNMPPTQVTKLDNGLTVATEERECFNTCIGFFIDAGSKYEANFQNGVTHFFEHIAFKETRCRKRELLENQMNGTGAKFKCHSSREMAVYYAECLCQDAPLIVDILSDCIFNNAFNHDYIENEKKTVYYEMLEHDKNVNALVDDYLHATAFQGTPLSQTVMGPSTNLYTFNSNILNQYIIQHFEPTRTVFVGVGGITHVQMLQLAKMYLSGLKPSTRCLERDVYRYTGSEIRFRNDSLPVANVAVAVEGPSFCDQDNVIMEVAASHIGGWDRTQPRGVDHPMKIAQASSLAKFSDAYKSFNINYRDSGLWGVQFISHSLAMEDMMYTIQQEFMKLCTCITEGELQRAKRNLQTKLLSKTESCLGTFMEVGRSLLYIGERPSLYERLCTIDAVHAEDVRSVCTKYIYDKCPVVAAVGPTEGLPDYVSIRAGMYWLRI